MGHVGMTVNINGFHRKSHQLHDLLLKEKAAFCVLQETLVKDRHYPITVPGFTAYSSPAKDGFRGLAILVDNRYPSYEVPHRQGDHLIYV
jgi:exonuclease III